MAFSYQVPATVVAGKAPRDECFARDCCWRRPRHRWPLGRQVILLLGSKQNRRPRNKSSEFSSVHLSTGYFIACGPPRSTLTPFFPVAAQCFIYNPSEAVLCCSLPCAQGSSKPKSSSGFFPVCLLIHSAVSTCGFVVFRADNVLLGAKKNPNFLSTSICKHLDTSDTAGHLSGERRLCSLS